MKYEIKPCPRCRRAPVIESRWPDRDRKTYWVAFHDCEETPVAYLEVVDNFATQQKAIEAWNSLIESLELCHNNIQSVEQAGENSNPSPQAGATV